MWELVGPAFTAIGLRIAYIFGEGDVVQKINGFNCKLIVKDIPSSEMCS